MYIYLNSEYYSFNMSIERSKNIYIPFKSECWGFLDDN